MSSLRHPVGPQPPTVYWRRRLVVGLGVLAVVIVIILIVVRPGGSAPNEGATPDPGSSEVAEGDTDSDAGAEGDEAEGDGAEPEAPSEPAGDPTACQPGQVEVTAVTDADVYSAEATPQLSFTIANVSDVPCIIQAGSDVQEFVITSGPDRIWSSVDCQVDPVPAERTLEPGEPLSAPSIMWNRTRSDPDNCGGETTTVAAGGATYRLTVTVGDFASESDRPFILN